MFGTPIIGLASNPVFHAVGEIFQPILRLVGYALALIYGLIPNYAIAIAVLTIVIMLLLTPLTIKSTKSMMAMQRMQPEMKKLQAKYKGPENRQKLNEELMKLYKEHGINPLGGCLPTFLQMPFLYILYDVIRGLTATTKSGAVSPRYIPKPTNLHAGNVPLIDRMYHNLLASGGQLKAFGMNLTLKPFSHHSSTAAAIPFFVFVVVAVGLQYFQMSQMTRRNPAAAQANRQAQNIQKLLPIFFGYIYFLIPSAVVIYMIVSTIIRIATQDILFRTGIVQVATPNAERTISGAKSHELSKGPASLSPGPPAEKSRPTKAAGPVTGPSKTASNGSSNGSGSRTNGNGSGTKPTGAGGSRTGQANGKTEPVNTEEDATAKAHPRAKNKRDRRAR